MRNLKRVLSLALAMVMMLGMMIITTSAAEATTKDFTDKDEITYNEAVDVLVALEVLEGDDFGAFNPTDILTREQAAKIICYMLIGPDNAEKLGKNSSIFTDVEAGRWSAGYIAYCVNLGILSGNGDGTFAPAGELTGVAFGKMLLVALGYDADIEGYVNNTNWATNIATDMIAAGIDVKGTTLSDPLTREQAAQMALQTLEADMVTYANKGTNITMADGTTVVVGASPATVITSASAGDYDSLFDEIGAGAGSNVLQFAEKYFSNLTQVPGTVNGRFGHVYAVKGQPVTDFVADDTVLYTSTDGTTVTNLLTKGNKGWAGYKLDDVVVAYLNGDQDTSDSGTDTTVVPANGAADGLFISSDATDLGDLKTWGDAHCGIGAVIELIDTDRNSKIDAIAITEYTISKITATTKELANGTEATITVPGMNGGAATAESLIDGDFANLKKQDVVIFADIAEPDGTYSYSIVYEPDTFTGKMTKYNATLHTMTIDGAAYKAAATTVNGTLASFTQAQAFTGTAESTFYVDANGYIVAVDGINNIQYAVIDSIAYVNASGVNGKGYAEARLVFTDGTTEVVTVKSIDGFTPIAAGVDLDTVKGTNGYYTGAQASAGAVTSAASTNATTDCADAAANKYYGFTVASGTGDITAKYIGIDSTASANTAVVGHIYTYSINDGKYVLTTEGTVAAGAATFTKGVPTIGTLGGVANDKTVYVVKTKDGVKDVWTTYTGYAAIPTMTSGTIVADYASTVAAGMTFVYVDATGATSIGDPVYDVAFFYGNTFTVDNTDPTKPLYEYTVILNGEQKTVVATSNLGVSANTLYKVTLNDNGQITATAAASGAKYDSVTADGTPAAKNGVLTIDSATLSNGDTTTSLTYNGSETVYYVHTVSKTVTTGSITDVANDAAMYVKTVGTNAANTAAEKLAISVAYVLVAD